MGECKVLAYRCCEKAFEAEQLIPSLVVQIAKLDNDISKNGSWGKTLDETWVYIARVIAHWSRVLKPVEWNYSPTEQEALALKEGLIQFQPFVEGEVILAVTNHAALTWSKTFQNVNHWLLTWGTVFAASQTSNRSLCWSSLFQCQPDLETKAESLSITRPYL